MSSFPSPRIRPGVLLLGILMGASVLPMVSAEATPKPVPTDAYQGHVQVVRGGAEDPETLVGAVFDDRDQDSTKDRNERGIAGVTVSNGHEVVTTDREGRYALPVRENMTVFVTQPAGWQVPVDENMVAQFHYNHLPAGSPDLKYGGLKPTGELPKAVNFPMTASKATKKKRQSCPIASDTQTYDMQQMAWARDGAVHDLMQRTDYGGCGILMLGDNVGDDLSLYPELQSIYAEANGPIRAVVGNHDMDYDAPTPDHANDTFREHYGPSYYSYDVGEAHIVALDSIEYPLEEGSRKYREEISQEQLDWLTADLAQVPRNKKIILATHAPIVDHRDVVVDNAPELYEVLDGYDVTTIGGHTHTLEHHRVGDRRAEWTDAGVPSLPADQLIAGAVSGGWYGGGLNEDGLPYAFGPDGHQPGVLTLELDGNDMQHRYTIRRESEDLQMAVGLNTPHWREWAEQAEAWREADKAGEMPWLGDEHIVSREELHSGESWITTNFYAGSTAADVQVSIDGKNAGTAAHTQPNRGETLRSGWEFSDPYAATRSLMTSGNVPKSGSNIWRLELPATLEDGTHEITVTATDEFGRTFTRDLRITVVDELPKEPADN